MAMMAHVTIRGLLIPHTAEQSTLSNFSPVVLKPGIKVNDTGRMNRVKWLLMS